MTQKHLKTKIFYNQMNNLNGIGDILTTIHQNLYSMNQVVKYHHTIIEKIKDDVNITQKKKDIDDLHLEMEKLELRIKDYLDNKISSLDLSANKSENSIEEKVSDALTQAVIKVSQSQSKIPDDSLNNSDNNKIDSDKTAENTDNKKIELSSNIAKPVTKKKNTKSRKKNVINDLDSEITNESENIT